WDTLAPADLRYGYSTSDLVGDERWPEDINQGVDILINTTGDKSLQIAIQKVVNWGSLSRQWDLHFCGYPTSLNAAAKLSRFLSKYPVDALYLHHLNQQLGNSVEYHGKTLKVSISSGLTLTYVHNWFAVDSNGKRYRVNCFIKKDFKNDNHLILNKDGSMWKGSRRLFSLSDALAHTSPRLWASSAAPSVMNDSE
ncbi:hypothetical protein HDU96_004531, partial [Phlyctochytrium bullatum]